ncbi:FAD-binding oxidoreductase [Hyphomonas sp.]|uniref:FAD-binding oxidoreductase n=1 Tax=Hyphomonas sp. TaxID=87 RepID=UPI0025B86170|nr:FAD-binding oxidoreductase [Hyphomonas sp.]
MLDQTKTDKLGELKSVLAQALGNDAVSDDPAARELFSQDIWTKGELAEFVVAPNNLEALSAAAAAANERGIAFNPRGGGMSYTKGYTPDREGVAILDMSRMNRILDLNVDDMYVTVEAGCTWVDLHEALSAKGVRTPFWGPLSGLSSTIGGGLSQNNAFFGAGKYGTTGDSVLSVTVVLADGTIVRTGSAGTTGAKPFWRHYGPDLTGLFCGDCGVLGYKAEITLRLIKAPREETWASYEFDNAGGYADAMSALMREDIATEIFGFDPNLTRVRMARASMLSDAKALKNVMKKQGNLLSALKEGAKVAMAGRGFMADAKYNLHYTVEGHSKAGVKEEIAILNAICEAHGGKSIENSIPKIIRANPFGPLNSILGPSGERWVPIHGLVPVSETRDCLAKIDAAFDAMRKEFDDHGIVTGYLLTSMSTTGVIIEPVFLWPEELFEIHRQTVEPGMLSKVGTHDANPAATAVVAKGRQVVLDAFRQHGAAHFQIGRTYPYLETREDATRALLEKIKDIVDPQRIINPGALGLE